MLLGNYFNENRRPNVDCSVLVFPKMEKENLSNKDRKKISFYFLCRSNPQLFVLYCKNWMRMAYFQRENYEKFSYNFTDIQRQYQVTFLVIYVEGRRAVFLSAQKCVG